MMKKVVFLKECGLKKFLFYFVSILFLEMFFKFSIFNHLEVESIVNILLLVFGLSALLSIITNLFSDKVNRVISAVLLFIIGVLFSVQMVFYNVFKTFFSFSILGLGDQLESFMGETVKAIIENGLYIIISVIPFILFLIFKKKISVKSAKISYIFYLVLLFFSVSLYLLNIYHYKDRDNSSYELYTKTNSVALNLEKFGVLNSYIIDIHRSIFGFSEEIELTSNEPIEEKKEEIVYDKNTLEINFDKATSNKEIQKINSYMQNDSGTQKNSYTGKYQGYNLIYIVAESFSEIAISEELTPTLYKLTHTGLVFDNYYTPNTLSTIGGEFQALTGLYPDSSILTKWRKGTNYFPYGLGTVYKNLGYKTYAYHDNWYGFQDRHKYLKSQGFTNYLGCYNGLEKRMNCKRWPQSDLEMMKVTMKDYINNTEPFLAYYMTVSGHFSYNFSDNSMASKNKKYVNNLKLSTAAKAYVATQIELDRALEYMINELDNAGKLDNTVIVLMADHYPYKLSMNDVNSLSSYKRDSVVEVNHNALILWNNLEETTHIDKPCMSSDVLPTIYNLFGVEYDSRLFTGKDILSTSDGLVILSNHSWVTSHGTYFASGSKFNAKDEVEEGYVSKINEMVKNRLSVGKLIIKNDYYKYLLK